MKANIIGQVSFHYGKKMNRRHNTREYDAKKWNTDEHINAERSEQNEIIVDKDLKKFFEEEFGEAIEKYNVANEKKHPDRVTSVEEYYNQQKDKALEFIVQMSDHDNYIRLTEQKGQTKADRMHKEYLEKVVAEWQEKNPSMKIFGAYIHMDETRDGTPHLHLDVLPVAESNRGLTKKVSMDGALGAIGFNREKGEKYAETSFKRFASEERKRVEALAKDYITVIPALPTAKGQHHKETYVFKEEQKAQNLGQRLLQAFREIPNKKNAKNILDNLESVYQYMAVEPQEQQAKIERLQESLMKLSSELDEKAMQLDIRENKTQKGEQQLKAERTQLELEKSKQTFEISSKVKQALEKEGYQTDYTAQAEQARQQAIMQKQIRQTKRAARVMKQKGSEQYGR